MCTVTWVTRPDGYDVFFNRDELRSRATAQGPQLLTRVGAEVIAPIDPDGGGTWIAVNHYGVAHCVLNHYPAESHDRAATAPRNTVSDSHTQTAGAPRSRGLLILELSDSKSPRESENRLMAVDTGEYLPFILLVLGPGEKPVAYRHNGAQALTRLHPKPPLTTSSFEPAEVQRSRAQVYEAMTAAPCDHLAALERFHRSELPKPGPFAVAMSREDAMTVSLSHISVSNDEVLFRYAPGHPTNTPFREWVRAAVQR